MMKMDGGVIMLSKITFVFMLCYNLFIHPLCKICVRGQKGMNSLPFPITRDQLVAFCQRWKIRELALFGSVLREDFSPNSDIDMLVTFAEDAAWSLFDHVQMQQELEVLLNRKVDLLSKRAVEQSQNAIRRNAILQSAQTLIAA